jgi:acetyl esterase
MIGPFSGSVAPWHWGKRRWQRWRQPRSGRRTHEPRGGPPLRGQVLQVPITDSSCNSESMRIFASGCVMSRANAKDMLEMYLASPEDAYHPYASPLHAENFADLPPALVIAGDNDVLLVEGLAYAGRLIKAGRPCETLGWKTPAEAFNEHLLLLQQAGVASID